MHKHPTTPHSSKRKVFDCFLYEGELDVLCIRLNELHTVVDRFTVVESDTTFSGLPRAPRYDPLNPKIARFAEKVRHVVVRDMPKTNDPWEREAWQRNAMLRGIPDAAANDLILISDVDEIPRATVVEEMAHAFNHDIFGLRLAFYYFYVNYRNVSGPEAAITWTVAAEREQLDKIAPNELRYAVRKGEISARIIDDAGWHFSYLMDEAAIKRKIANFSHQEFNNPKFLDTIDVQSLVHRRADLFNRPGFEWSVVSARELPEWLQRNRRSMQHLFFATGIQRICQRLTFPGTRLTVKSSAPAAPVIVCPYLHDWEPQEMKKKFGLDDSRGRKLNFFMWQDREKIGPEHAFQHCWEQFPDRDIIIVHSDMAPMPHDVTNEWYDTLLEFRKALPHAGMIACNLFYPRSGPEDGLRVQCAGGTFHKGEISHLHGPVGPNYREQSGELTEEMLARTRQVEWVTFAGVLIRREVIRACGSFDERYEWAYVMDVDYSFEARLRGYHLFQVPVALQHEENRTTRELWKKDRTLLKRVARNFDVFNEKWRPFASVLMPVGSTNEQ